MLKLPTIAHTVQADCQPAAGMGRGPGLPHLPSWDQPAVIKLDPINPPSPYRPSLPRHRYPTVLESLPRVSGVRAEASARPGLHSFGTKGTVKPDESLFEYEYACVLNICKREKESREDIIFEEQRISVRLWVDYLAEAGIHLSNDICLREEEARNLIEREEERRYMCFFIEMTSTADNMQRRFEANLRKQIEEIMPDYKRMRETAVEEEKQDLKTLLTWFKDNRPFNMILPSFLFEEDKNRRRLPPSLCKRKLKPVTNTRSKRYDSIHTSNKDNSTDRFLEEAFLEEGRRAWRVEKQRGFAGHRMTLKINDINNEEVATRDDIIMEELLQRVAFDTAAIASMCDVKMKVAKRRTQEAKMEKELLIEEEKRKAILDKLKEEAILKGENELNMCLLDEPTEKEMQLVNAIQHKQAESVSPPVEDRNCEKLSEEVSPCGKYTNLNSQEEHEALQTLIEFENNLRHGGGGAPDCRATAGDSDSKCGGVSPAGRLEGRSQQRLSLPLERASSAALTLKTSCESEAFKEFQASIRSRDSSASKRTDIAISVEDERVILDVLKVFEDSARMRENMSPEDRHVAECVRNVVCAPNGSKGRDTDVKSSGDATATQTELVRSLEEEHEILNLLMEQELKLQVANDAEFRRRLSGGGVKDCMFQRGTPVGVCCGETPSTSPDSAMFPMLNIVLSIAAERDPYVMLGNSALSALGEAECTIAASAGRKVGEIARVFAQAQYTPLCPVYLLRGLWCTESSTGSSLDSEDVEELTVQLLQWEARERNEIIHTQIDTIWELYNKAAKEASCLTNTGCGDVYYVGVRIHNESLKRREME